MAAWVTIATFRDLPEAYLAIGKLESAAIEAYLDDEEIISMDWFWSNAMGGVKLRVHEDDADAAFDLLAMPIPAALQQEGGEAYRQPVCLRCGSLDISVYDPVIGYRAFVLSFLAIPLPIPRMPRWKCESCGAQWKEIPDENATGNGQNR